MFKKKPFFIVFEGIEGSGKSYLSRKLYKKLLKKNIPTILTREPGGTNRAESIRKIILNDYFEKKNNDKFHKYTDTLLYLAARNEHVQNVIRPSLVKKKVVICDRFIDSTIAYQVYGKGVKLQFIKNIHKEILNKLKPDLTFVLKVNISTSSKRLKKRKTKNRYDNFSKKFYNRAQKAFIKIANENPKKYFIIDNSKNDNEIQNKIYNIVSKRLN
ncbi:MAG: dTMP kinase [Candidatus Marinimicrobia bacterium]|nr:dTMP kinase [Candidatus Neomarinimicrobiota bacterium]|tara:strand:- start:5738 stop:6382 length:645 start_codon:yes stop_codon:yes gene_type:complete